MTQEKSTHVQIQEEFDLTEKDLLQKAILLLSFLYEKEQEGNKVYVFFPSAESEGEAEDKQKGSVKLADIKSFLQMPLEDQVNESDSQTEMSSEEPERAVAEVA